MRVSNRSGHRGTCLTCQPVDDTPKPTRPEFPQDVRHAMCGKKHRYPTQALAFRAALKSARRTIFIRVYPCPICDGFHLTHKPKKEIRS